ncbi:phytoene/squalene synthase family protein [Corynebacterium sp. Q4381]|uniref:phytoene/squalene synthase family protein n=1 Tax=Corynebacterium sp. Marseille-Q4381 TaxID=3121597 RepID=UPI002FE519CB
MCDRAAAQVIASYSTSFSLASRILPPTTRRDINNLYAMARVADEIVDGTALEAGADPATLIADYERAVLAAPAARFHTDPVLHAYAASARRCGFTEEHVRAFFASMRRDIRQVRYTREDFDEYVYGSAEVIGLLCLSAFLVGEDPAPANRARMEAGARALGSAFQKINFLRDFGEDRDTLGRRYLPEGMAPDDATKAAVTAGIREELAEARAAIPLLPAPVRGAVAAAEALFRELTTMLEQTDAADLAAARVSVPASRKIMITARAAVTKGALP